MLFPKIAPLGQRVGLLQFADDLLLFLQINKKTMTTLSKTLLLFEEEAGQCINKKKSQLMFSRNTFPTLTHLTKDTLQITRSVSSFDYLGTLLALDRTQHSARQHTLNRIQVRIHSWRGSLLSPAGRLILIQAVTSVIPSYWLGHTSIPGRIVKQFNRMNDAFFWSRQST